MGGLVWLASYPRSGNTWTRAFLHNLLEEGGGADINRMSRFTSTDNAPRWYLALSGKASLLEHSDQEIAALRPRVHRAMSEAAEGLVFVKTHDALASYLGTPLITREFTAGAIYILRNPLDVAVSYSHFLGIGLDETIARMNLAGHRTPTHERGVYQFLGSWSENVLSWTRRANPSLHVMRYEDMLERPEETFAALVRFLRLEVGRDRLHDAIERSAFARLRQQEEAGGFREKPESAGRFFREGRAGQWPDALSDGQIRAIVAAHREQMQRFGYVPEGY